MKNHAYPSGSRGFALIEMIIASAILGIVLFGVMQVGTVLSQISSGAKFTGDFTNLTSSLNSIINNAATCKSSIVAVPTNSPFNPVAAQQTTTTPGGMDITVRLPGTSPPTVIQAGGIYREFGVKVLSVKLYGAIPAGVSAAGTKLWSGVLQLNAVKLSSSPLGGASLSARDIGRFVVQVDAAGSIQDCGAAISNAQDACLAVGGVYNPATNTCQRCSTYAVSAYGTAACYCPSTMNVYSAGAGMCNAGDVTGLATGVLTGIPTGYRQDCSTTAGALAFSTCTVTCCSI